MERVYSPLRIFRPAVKGIVENMSNEDKMLVEEGFQRLVLQYDRVFTGERLFHTCPEVQLLTLSLPVFFSQLSRLRVVFGVGLGRSSRPTRSTYHASLARSHFTV